MDQQVDVYIAKLKNWQAEIKMLRSILLDCKLEEAIKWGQPCYGVNNKNFSKSRGEYTVCKTNAFYQHSRNNKI